MAFIYLAKPNTDNYHMIFPEPLEYHSTDRGGERYTCILFDAWEYFDGEWYIERFADEFDIYKSRKELIDAGLGEKLNILPLKLQLELFRNEEK